VPQTLISDRINAARTVIQNCRFNRTRCKDGLNSLRSWGFKYDHERKTFGKEPDHNWASHGSDGFSYGAQVMRERDIVSEKPKPAFNDPLRLTFLDLVKRNTKKREAAEAEF
jgi:phage terminase large subunit